MNYRKIFRLYAQSKGKEAKEFVRIDKEPYQNDTLITKGNSGQTEETSLDYEKVLYFMQEKFKIVEK